MKVNGLLAGKDKVVDGDDNDNDDDGMVNNVG